VSAPETRARERIAAIELRSCAADILELAPFHGRAEELRRLMSAHGSSLPPVGHLTVTAQRRVLCVRPGRWLLLEPRGEPGTSAARWESDCAGIGTAVDLTSALSTLDLTGAAVREVLARGCRLDLALERFPEGRAARTVMAQVPVILGASSAGVMLLTSSTMARHFSDWLVASAKPFGLSSPRDLATMDSLGPSAGALQT